MFSCAVLMNCRSVAEQVCTTAAWPLPPKSRNEPATKIARASPAAAEKRGFTGRIVGDPARISPSPVRGRAVEKRPQTPYSAEAGSRGMGRKRHLLAAAIAVFALASTGAQAAGPPDEPDLEAMALAVGDFDGGGIVDSQRFVTAPAPIVAEYERYFRPGARLAGRRLLYAANIDFSLDDASTTQLAFSTLVQQLNTSAGRKQLASGLPTNLRENTGGRIKIKSISIGRPLTLQFGQGAFRLAIVLKTNIGRDELAITGVRVDRAIGLIALAAYPGHWAGGPGSFTYQWNRCAAAGTPCTPIAGATAQTYVPTAADSGSRLSVTVTASNSVSQSSATSVAGNPVP